jgi:hypothetical protein
MVHMKWSATFEWNPGVPNRRIGVDAADVNGNGVRFFCHRPFDVLVDGEPLSPWPGPRQVRLLQRLVHDLGRPVPLGALVDSVGCLADAAQVLRDLRSLADLFASRTDHLTLVVTSDTCSMVPSGHVWVDADAFEAELLHVRRASNLRMALIHLRRAEALYGRDYLVECRHEQWSSERRAANRRAHDEMISLIGPRLAVEPLAFCNVACGAQRLDAEWDRAHRRMDHRSAEAKARRDRHPSTCLEDSDASSSVDAVVLPMFPRSQEFPSTSGTEFSLCPTNKAEEHNDA